MKKSECSCFASTREEMVKKAKGSYTAEFLKTKLRA
jgi:hypothetical protein